MFNRQENAEKKMTKYLTRKTQTGVWELFPGRGEVILHKSSQPPGKLF